MRIAIFNFIKKNKIFFLLLLSAILIILRKPDNLFHAQFLAEDGRYWYADCYNLGFKCLLMPQDGYLQTISRLAGLVSFPFPLAWAPTIFVLIALLIQLLPVYFLLSPQFEQIIPKFWLRALLALLYITLPNINGSFLILTCSQWYLALTAGLLITLSANWGKWKKFVSWLIILLSGLSGPFAIFLLPVSFLKWLKTRRSEDLVGLMILIITSLIQAVFIFHYMSITQRFQGHIPWSIQNIYSAVSIQLIWNFLLSPKGYWWLHNSFNAWHTIANYLALPVFFLILYAFIKARFEIKLYMIYAALLGIVGLIFPMGIDRNDLFHNIASNLEQLRYWLIPLTAVLASLIFCSQTEFSKPVKLTARFFLALSIIGIVLNFYLPQITPLPDFPGYAKKFEQLKPGQSLTIPLNPVPSYWKMTLIKH